MKVTVVGNGAQVEVTELGAEVDAVLFDVGQDDRLSFSHAEKTGRVAQCPAYLRDFARKEARTELKAWRAAQAGVR